MGVPEEMLLGDRLFQMLHARDAYLVQDTWKQAVETGTPFEVQARIRNDNGEYRWFLIRAFPQRSEDGTIARWYGLHIDIEDREREQQSLTARQERLSRLSRNLSMSEVAVSIAHELNQPMTALMTHAYACREWASCNPPNVEKLSLTAEKIVQETTRASAVVKRVRSLFSQDEPVRTETDLNHLIQDSALLLRDDAIRQSVRVELDLDAELPSVEVDPVQIQQVILNLSKNAIEAMTNSAGDRVLEISTQRPGDDEILVQVKDSGPGIAQEFVASIFEPFFSTKKNGTGIGLAICRSIVEAHSGRISARNNPGRGVTFQFTIRTRA
jgi:PAS domain S-box-containing protein